MKALKPSSFTLVLVLVNFFCTGLHAGAEGVSLKLATKSGETIEAILSPSGETRIRNYPKWSQADVTVRLISSPFAFTEITNESCYTIREKAKKLSKSYLPESVKKQLLSGIRELSTIKVDFQFSDFISQTWLKAEVKKAADSAGITTGAIEITNPIELSQIRVAIKASENSITNLLGEDTLLKQQVETLFTENTLRWGSVSREFSQLDFLCDLVEGNMQLSLQVQGEEKNTPVYGQIIPLSLARELTGYLLENSNVFLKDRTPFSFPRNYMKAGILAERFWKRTEQREIPLALWSKLIEQLLDAQTGLPKEISESELVISSRYVVKNHTPYSADVHFKPLITGEP